MEGKTIAAPLPDPEVIRLYHAFRAAILNEEAAQLERLGRAWLGIERRLSAELIATAEEIARHAGDGVITQQLLARSERLRILLAQAQDEVARFAQLNVLPDIEREQAIYARLGLRGAQEMIDASGGVVLSATWLRMPLDAIEAYIGLTGDGSPLRRLLEAAYPEAVEGIINGLVTGMAKGYGPNQIAMLMAQGFGLGLERLTLIARTEQLRVWRLSSQDQYIRSGVVTGYKRIANKSDRTCMACLILDGEEYATEHEFEEHPRGRCALVPIVRHAPSPLWETGEQWFLKLPLETQQSMMGGERWELWRDGQFALKDLVGYSHSPVWGTSPRIKTLEELPEASPA